MECLYRSLQVKESFTKCAGVDQTVHTQSIIWAIALYAYILVYPMIVIGWFLFVCVEVLRPSQPNGIMSSAVSLPNHTFTGAGLVL